MNIEISPALLWKMKSIPIFEKIPWLCLNFSMLNFSFKMLFQEYLGEKTPRFFAARPFFHVLQMKSL